MAKAFSWNEHHVYDGLAECTLSKVCVALLKRLDIDNDTPFAIAAMLMIHHEMMKTDDELPFIMCLNVRNTDEVWVMEGRCLDSHSEGARLYYHKNAAKAKALANKELKQYKDENGIEDGEDIDIANVPQVTRTP